MKLAQGKNGGFTLIELMVVISIFSFLVTTVLASTNKAQSKAQDAKMLAEHHEIQTAMDTYHDDHGSFPNPDPGHQYSYCLTQTCQVAGVAITRHLDPIGGFSIGTQNPPPTYVGDLANQGYVYVPGCDPAIETCPDGQSDAFVLSVLSGGTPLQHDIDTGITSIYTPPTNTPVLTSLSNLSGRPGATLSIYGSNLNAGNNSVTFGDGTSNTSVSGNAAVDGGSLTVTVPSSLSGGSDDVSVTINYTDGSSAISNSLPFNVESAAARGLP